MRSIRILFAVLALALLHGVPANADPFVNLTWSACTTVIPDAIVRDGSNQDGTFHVARVNVTGHSAPHSGYALRFTLRATDGGALPDAWRVEPGGCQDGISPPPFWIEDNPVVELVRPTTCSNLHRLQPPTAPTTKVVAYDPVSGVLTIEMRRRYLPPSTPPDPTWWYGLVQVIMDHTYSRIGEPADIDGHLCGGLERAVCLSLVDARWIGPDGIEHPWTIGNGTITAHIAGIPPGTCGAVPARAATWGTLKKQYR